MYRRLALVPAVALLCAPMLQAQVQTPMTRPVDVTVRVVMPNDRQAPEQLRVQLMKASGGVFMESTTDGRGSVDFPRVQAGEYYVKVTGIGVQDTQSENFILRAGQNQFTIWVRVDPAKAADGSQPPQPPVSAAELNVPARAWRDLERGRKAMQRSRPEEARRHFEAALAVHPQFSQAHSNLGVLAMQAGDLAEGRKRFELALQADENNATACVNMGKMHIREGRHAEAEALLLRALAGEPNNPEILLLLANSQFVLGKHEPALANARKVHLFPHPQLAIAHLLAAQILEQQGALGEAITEYRQFLAEDPNGTSAQRAQQAVQRLERRMTSRHSGN